MKLARQLRRFLPRHLTQDILRTLLCKILPRFCRESSKNFTRLANCQVPSMCRLKCCRHRTGGDRERCRWGGGCHSSQYRAPWGICPSVCRNTPHCAPSQHNRDRHSYPSWCCTSPSPLSSDHSPNPTHTPTYCYVPISGMIPWMQQNFTKNGQHVVKEVLLQVALHVEGDSVNFSEVFRVNFSEVFSLLVVYLLVSNTAQLLHCTAWTDAHQCLVTPAPLQLPHETPHIAVRRVLLRFRNRTEIRSQTNVFRIVVRVNYEEQKDLKPNHDKYFHWIKVMWKLTKQIKAQFKCIISWPTRNAYSFSTDFLNRISSRLYVCHQEARKKALLQFGQYFFFDQ